MCFEEMHPRVQRSCNKYTHVQPRAWGQGYVLGSNIGTLRYAYMHMCWNIHISQSQSPSLLISFTLTNVVNSDQLAPLLLTCTLLFHKYFIILFYFTHTGILVIVEDFAFFQLFIIDPRVSEGIYLSLTTSCNLYGRDYCPPLKKGEI